MSHATPTTPLEKAQHAEILELESQIRSLNTKISATVDHAADLQDELRTLRARQREEQEAREREAGESSLRRMSTYFASVRRPSVQAMMRQDSQSPRGSRDRGREQDGENGIDEELARERKTRIEVEGKYKALQEESEVLSQSLFEEANKMVSTERKALHAVNVKLSVVQEREADRRRRMDELEKALTSIQRARTVLTAGHT